MTIQALLICFACFMPYDEPVISQHTDQSLLEKAAKHKTTTTQPSATTQPYIRNTIKIEKHKDFVYNKYDYQPMRDVIANDDFDDFFDPYDKELNNFRKNQKTVENGIVSYPNDWLKKCKDREQYKDGVLAKGPMTVDADGKTKQVVVYDITDLLYEPPNFGLDKDDFWYKNTDDNYPDYFRDRIDTRMQLILEKKQRRAEKAKQIELLVKSLTNDQSVVIISGQ